jgi:hypothetical protein
LYDRTGLRYSLKMHRGAFAGALADPEGGQILSESNVAVYKATQYSPVR